MVDQIRLSQCYEDVLGIIRAQREESAKEKEYFWSDETQKAQLRESISEFLSQDNHQLSDSLDFYQKLLKDDEKKPLSTQDRIKYQTFFLTVGEYLGGEPLPVEQNTQKKSSKVVCLNMKQLLDKVEQGSKFHGKDDGTIYLCNLPYCKGRRSKSVMEYTFPNGEKKTLYKSAKNKKNFFRHIGSHFICVNSGHKEHYIRDLKLLKTLFPKYILAVPNEESLRQPGADNEFDGSEANWYAQDYPSAEKRGIDIVRDEDRLPQKSENASNWFHLANSNFDILAIPESDNDFLDSELDLK